MLKTREESVMSSYGPFRRWAIRGAVVLAILAAVTCGPDISSGAGSPVPGYSGWTYLDSGGSTWYFYNNYSRFTYNTTTGKWSAYDQYGKKWQTLSGNGASSSYIFDGVLHNLCNGWKYVYSNAAQMGNWARSDTGAARFGYSFSTGRWYEYDLYGGATWRLLSLGGCSGYFVGNGALNNLGNGWKFVYGYAADSGNWAKSDTGAARFGYNFTTGRWYEYSISRWVTIGLSGKSSAFLGDGQYHNIGLTDFYFSPSTPWYYKYSNDIASYAIYMSGSYFDNYKYNYQNAQWTYNTGSAWYNLSTSGKASGIKYVSKIYLNSMWTFSSSVDPSSFDFNPSNSSFWFLMYDSNNDEVRDKIEYYDDRGHKVLSGLVQPGSKGIRIAVDKSWVTASSSWNSYFSFWKPSWPSSPLVLVYDANGNQLFKQTITQWMTSVGSEYFIDGRAWVWEDTNGNGLYDSNWSSSGDRILQWYQQKGGTCGIFATMNITASVLGNGSSQTIFPTTFADNTIGWYSTTFGFVPAYDPSTMNLNDGAWNNYGGTTSSQRNTFLTSWAGFTGAISGSGYTFTQLVSCVESGQLVHVGLDAYEIWASKFAATDLYGTPRDADYDGYLDAGYVTSGDPATMGGHAVWVRGFVRDASNNITHVIIMDSALDGGALGKVPIDHFLRSWNGYGGWAGYVSPPSGHTWSTAGVNTWSFNPAVYSTSW
jgi:hypothetical protein